MIRAADDFETIYLRLRNLRWRELILHGAVCSIKASRPVPECLLCYKREPDRNNLTCPTEEDLKE